MYEIANLSMLKISNDVDSFNKSTYFFKYCKLSKIKEIDIRGNNKRK